MTQLRRIFFNSDSEYVDLTWKLITHDVSGNSRDGYVADGEHDKGLWVVRCKTKIASQTGRKYAFPTNKQICKAFGIRCRVWLDGDKDLVIVLGHDDSQKPLYPFGEMYLQKINDSEVTNQPWPPNYWT